ncbi:predicted protein [Histoplasma capsulatum var. duboisii H88]|uniref:Predicted protein n=2 Tax=Ajellomyces capsulatus TaxID=5037 RepID=F0UC97_AJEC8|nr:predicted protein [Histoplasma capsulatum H143]EGC43197.1 predicted protein [Histoplasma capsulatum var. duboisii H88]
MGNDGKEANGSEQRNLLRLMGEVARQYYSRNRKRHRGAEGVFPNSTYDALTHPSYRSFCPGRVAIVRRLWANQGSDFDCLVYLSSTVNTAQNPNGIKEGCLVEPNLLGDSAASRRRPPLDGRQGAVKPWYGYAYLFQCAGNSSYRGMNLVNEVGSCRNWLEATIWQFKRVR